MYESSSESSFSSESSEEPTYLNLNVLPKPYRKNSNCCLHQCINGHCLVLTPVTCERISACGSCYAKIRIKPVHVLCYHCTECDLDSCSDCISTDMKEILMHERSKATPSVQFTDIHGPGLYQGQLSPIKKREGHGRMDWTSENSPLKGSFYEGNWKNDKREGHGKFVYPDGGVYEGLWENDVKCGYGRRSFSNGFKYHGAFKNGMKHGKGIFKGVTGRWCFAAWENDQMVGPGRFPPKAKASVGLFDEGDD